MLNKYYQVGGYYIYHIDYIDNFIVGYDKDKRKPYTKIESFEFWKQIFFNYFKGLFQFKFLKFKTLNIGYKF